MIVKINGMIVEPDNKIWGPDWWNKFWESPAGQWINGISDNVIGVESDSFGWVIENVVYKILDAIGTLLVKLGGLLNHYSVEIIVLAIISCGFGIMTAPLYGGSPPKWYGRLFGATLAGIIWRMMI